MTRSADIPRVSSYTGACHLLRERDSRVIGNNTKLVRSTDRVICVRLHQTNVVKFFRDEHGNTIRLDTGGWRTRVTLDRMNAVLPEGVRVLASCWRGHRFNRWVLSAPGQDIDGLSLFDGAYFRIAPEGG